MYSQSTIQGYLQELASKSPVPGGGSVAALIAATAAALLGKVANFTTGKDKFRAVESEMQNILQHCRVLAEECTILCSEDAKVYKKFSEVYNMPKGDERKKKMQETLKGAASVPLEVCKKCHDGAKLCLPVAEKGNANLITDTGIAADMFEGAFRAALLNVEINLKYIEDKNFIAATKKILGPIEQDIRSLNTAVNEKVKNFLKT